MLRGGEGVASDKPALEEEVSSTSELREGGVPSDMILGEGVDFELDQILLEAAASAEAADTAGIGGGGSCF